MGLPKLGRHTTLWVQALRGSRLRNFLREVEVRVPCRSIAVIVRSKQDGIADADDEYAYPDCNHSVVVVPRSPRISRPHHIKDGEDSIQERCQVNQPSPTAETKHAAWFPSASAG